MSLEIFYNSAAFKHGIAIADIENAISLFLFDSALEGEYDKYLLIGFDTNGNLLEIMYNVNNDDSISVFHAMKCRKEYIRLLER